MPDLTEIERTDNAVAVELWTWRTLIEKRLALCLSEAVFPDTDPAARVARHQFRLLIDELGERSAELTHDMPDPDEE